MDASGIAAGFPSLQDFSRHLGDRFQTLWGSADPVELEFIEAAQLRSRPRGDNPNIRSDPFSLLFRGPFAPALPQRIHRLVHPQLGPLEIFLVPIGPDAAGARYEAIFN